jgi:choline kinase
MTSPVVLAAGLGSRLGGVPKALYAVNGEPLLERCAKVLAVAGFDELTILTGHGAEDVRCWWDSAPRRVRGRFLHNSRFAELNNFHTVALACSEMRPGPLLILNSDIVFTPTVVVDAITAGGDLTLAVEPGSIDKEALKIRLCEGAVQELGKHIEESAAYGEFIGISALSARGRSVYTELAEDALAQAETSLYYEDVYSRMAGMVDVRVSAVSAGSWAEIDAPSDVPNAARVALRNPVPSRR